MSSQDSAAAAMSLLRGDAIEAAEAMLQRLLAGSPRDPMALHVMSLLLLRRGEADKDKNRDKALAFALAATEAAPAHPGLHYALANLLHDAGRAAEAVPVFAEAVRLKPAFFEAWNNLGLAAQDCGDLSGAEQALRHALSIRPDSTGALANLASVLRQVQRPAEAFDCLRGRRCCSRTRRMTNIDRRCGCRRSTGPGGCPGKSHRPGDCPLSPVAGTESA